LLADAPAEDDIDALVRRLEVGVPAGALSLLELPIPLTCGEYLALLSEGLTTPSAVLGCRTGTSQSHPRKSPSALPQLPAAALVTSARESFGAGNGAG